MSSASQKAIIYTSHEHSIYVGRLERTYQRANVSSTLLVSLEDELELLDQANRPLLRSKSLLIPAGTDLKVDTHNAKVALCFLDDLGNELASLTPQMGAAVPIEGGVVFAGIRSERDIIVQADFLSDRRPTNTDAMAMFMSWVQNSGPRPTAIDDARIAKAVRLIRDSHEQNVLVADIAKQVNLSIPRLIQLFKQVTGTPIRRFRLWHRIFATAAKLTEGYSLTDAAISAGFSDYSQFSRVYRELAGGSPAAAKNNTEIRVQPR